jgi:lipopolysaccharide/colanic/teichoic acid biosynthesis glycosyltransferase
VGYEVVKRGLDLVGSAAGLVAAAPVLAGCAAWIKCVDGGPVLYRQWRVGHGGVLFRIYKLRTMRSNAERPGTAQFAASRDPRVMPGCAWMRRSHVDELPQLWNILKGDMSLVGPRPERPEIYEELRATLPKVERRLEGRPGLTGLAQIRHGYTNDLAGARRKLAYDLRYLRRRSLLTELSLVLRTIPKVWDQAAL